MKKVVIILFTLFLFALPLASAEIIFNQQPQGVYNLGDIIPISVTVTSTGSFQMNLVCNEETNFYKEAVTEQKTISTSLPLTKDIINNSLGDCRIKGFVGSDSAFTQVFKVSDLITINANFGNEFSPGKNIFISGNAVKENGKSVNGVIEFSIIEGNLSVVSKSGTITNSAFSVNASLPQNMKAGVYLARLSAYETNILGITNKGFVDKNIRVRQVPTSLEIVFEQSSAEVQPGTNLRVKAVLYDQTGEKIQSTSFITIKNNNDKILEQREIATDEFLEYPIRYNEAPSSWKVVAVSNKLSSETSFKILEKEAANIEIINKTVIITNTGNIPYNKTVLIKIGEEPFNIDVFLKVDESKKYALTAPDGEYTVGVTADGETTEQSVFLTGSAIDVKASPGKIGSLIGQYFVVWIFIILILGFVAFLVIKKGYQRSFIGYITSRRKGKNSGAFGEGTSIGKKSLVSSKNRAELSLSIKGDRQDVSVVALHIKNLNELQSKKGNIEETLQKAVDAAEENKALTYENHSAIFFILAPARTRTFKNERAALLLAKEIREIILHHNKMFSQKINFGISLNHGTIVAKQEPDKGIFKFMSLGTLMSGAKKISSLAHEEILIGEKMNDKLRSHVKTAKHVKDGVTVYSIKEIKNPEEHSRFIRNFLDRLEGK